MPLFQGVGGRIRDRLIALGYVREKDGKPDVRRFALDKRYDKNLVYFWLRDRNTPMKELERLSRDLGVSVQWLLFGDGKRKRGRRILVSLLLTTAVVLGAGGTPWDGAQARENMPLIGVRRWWWRVSGLQPLVA